ncbi:hypothetical protein CUJ83_11090 [Methanocella sp. CWC-04]|uniref:Uncharacterized protein n=2 Tax=Methanooceanicella nereidis TaxID=2052831 RepID=A0AAP2W7T2_9EURY|nr:hypothetical protein [Methanocella sp. CWC-04]
MCGCIGSGIARGEWGEVDGIKCKVVNVDTETIKDNKNTITVMLQNTRQDPVEFGTDCFRLNGKVQGQHYTPKSGSIKLNPGETKEYELDFSMVLFGKGAYESLEFLGPDKDGSAKYNLDQ